jgi:MFS family permease
LTSVLGVPVAIVGLIEGIAESTASILKVVSGWLSDKFQRRKPFVVAGYSFSAISKIILSLAFSWPFVFYKQRNQRWNYWQIILYLQFFLNRK